MRPGGHRSAGSIRGCGAGGGFAYVQAAAGACQVPGRAASRPRRGNA